VLYIAQRMAKALAHPSQKEAGAQLCDWVLQQPIILQKLHTRLQRPALEVSGMLCYAMPDVSGGRAPHQPLHSSCGHKQRRRWARRNGSQGSSLPRMLALPLYPGLQPTGCRCRCPLRALQHPVNGAFTYLLVCYLGCCGENLAEQIRSGGLLRTLEQRFQELWGRCGG